MHVGHTDTCDEDLHDKLSSSTVPP